MYMYMFIVFEVQPPNSPDSILQIFYLWGHKSVVTSGS